MEIRELIDLIEKDFDISKQESWDNTGLQIGDTSVELNNILLCLDVTEEAIDKAIETNSNLIISHHPIIFESLKSIDTGFKGKKIIKAIKNDIVVYSLHTPADMMGLNKYVFSKLGYKSKGKIVDIEDLGYGDYFDISISKDEIINNLKSKLNIEKLVFYGDKKEFKRIGLLTGSGMDFVDDAINKNIDLMITGDITHHHALDSVEKGINLIDITHEGSEKLFVEFFYEYLTKLVELKNSDINKFYNPEKYKAQFL